MSKSKNKSTKKQEHLQLLEESEAILKVIYWFFGFPTKEISLNDLKENVGISKTTANRVVNRLVEDGFLNKEILGKTWRISCNTQHEYNTSIKIPFNLQIVYQSGIIQEIHKKVPNARAIILFGSYRKGDDVETSDLDIAIEVVDNEDPEIIEFGKLNLGYRENVKVNLHIFSRNKIDLNLYANMVNGVVLTGFLEPRI